MSGQSKCQAFWAFKKILIISLLFKKILAYRRLFGNYTGFPKQKDLILQSIILGKKEKVV